MRTWVRVCGMCVQNVWRCGYLPFCFCFIVVFFSPFPLLFFFWPLFFFVSLSIFFYFLLFAVFVLCFFASFFFFFFFFLLPEIASAFLPPLRLQMVCGRVRP
eukprot:TRINITY_DN10106_c1_g1_i1.p5 TRINITY_DN10106_c1_g1~~TRINITY_DN10106_c1_g1_i1.p5  ORF type:complete len:102 (-),score=4.42 TRINITY_DN10106_c1_g1_i1:375-680(-)